MQHAVQPWEFAVYLHSSQRVGGRSLIEACAELNVAESVLLAGDEGFGRHSRLRGVAEEGPVPQIVVATTTDDASAASFTALLAQLPAGTLRTRCRVARLDATAAPLAALGDEDAALIVHCRRGAGIGGVVELLRRHGIAGATAMSGTEGTVGGTPYHDPPFLRTPAMPARVVAVDAARRLAAAAPALLACDCVDLVTARPIWVWKRRGRLGGTPIAVDAEGWRTLTVFTADDTYRNPRPRELLGRLRKAGAAGATVVRGELACTRDDPIRPQRAWRRQREAPMVTTIVDTRDRIARWFEIVDDVVGDDGLVTCEAVQVLIASP